MTKTVRRIIKIACIAVPALIIVVVLIVFFALNGIVKSAVEAVAPKVTGTPVTLERVRISALTGKGTISGLVIGNPEGFKTPHAFALGTVRVDIDLPSLMSDKIIIEEIYIDAPEVTYEMGLSGSNIGKIQENVEAFAGPPSKEEDPEEDEAEGKKIQINHFVFKNAKIGLSAKLLQGSQLSVPLPSVELHDIGKESDGVSIAQAAKEVFTPLTKQITAVASAALTGAKELAASGVDAAKKAGGVVTDTAKGAVQGVKGLFKKD